MSAPESTPSCSACGGALPEGARFCPECGAGVAGRVSIEAAPASAPRDAPAPRLGLLAGPLLAGAAAALAAAIALFVLGHWIGGPVMLGISAALLTLYAGTVTDQPRPAPAPEPEPEPEPEAEPRPARRPAGAGLGERVRARRQQLSLRRELRDLIAERKERLHVLGEAAVGGDERRIAAARSALQALDDRIAALEARAAELRESEPPQSP